MAAPAYNYNNHPTAVGGVASEQLFTAYQFVQDNPQFRRQLMDRHPKLKKNFFSLLKELGLGTRASGPELGHYEKDWPINNFQIGTIVTAPSGPGQPGIYALDPGSMLTSNFPGVGMVTFSYPSERDIVYLPNGKSAFLVKKNTDVNPHQITLKPLNDTDTLVGAITAGGRYFIGDNASPEGSGSVESKVARYFKYTNVFQIFKSKFSITGTALTNQLPFKNIEGKEGSFLIEGTTDSEALHMWRLSKGLFFGQTSNNLTGYSEGLGHDVQIKTTQGMDQYVEQEGHIVPTTPGTFGIENLDSVDEILTRERAGADVYLLPMGYNLFQSWNNNMIDFMKDNCFPFVKGSFQNSPIFSETDGNDHFLWLDFAGARKNGRTWLAKHFSELDEQMGAGTEGYSWKNTGYALPVDMFENKGGTNPKQSCIGYEYKALNGYSREFEMYNHGGAGPITKTSEIDAMNLEWRSEIGGHFGLGNQWVKFKPVA
ncbi:hypothetical protein [Sphingobacterium detergens]|uniref:hypothetical protein n=1 Tax=Sphingobacterium detergens TaxID=1145106 RepID=UPI003AAAC7C3